MMGNISPWNTHLNSRETVPLSERDWDTHERKKGSETILEVVQNISPWKNHLYSRETVPLSERDWATHERKKGSETSLEVVQRKNSNINT